MPILPSRGHWVTSGDILLLQVGTEDATCIQWVEARDAAKHPMLQRTDLVQNVNGSDGEKCNAPSWFN